MAENRRFYYLKLKENFYNSETMVVLENMPDGGDAGDAKSFLHRPGITPFTARSAPQTGPNTANGCGQGKRGLVRRKSTTEKSAYIKTFRTVLNGWLIHFMSSPLNGP